MIEARRPVPRLILVLLRVVLLCLAASPTVTLFLLGGREATALLAQPGFQTILTHSLLLNGAASLLGLGLAMPAAAAIAGVPPLWRRVFAAFIALPLLLPPPWLGQGLARAIAPWDASWLAPAQWRFRLMALLLAHTVPGAAFSALILLGMVRPTDAALRASAEANGAGFWRSWALALGPRAPLALLAAALAAFVGANGFALADGAFADPTLGGLIASALASGDDPSPGVMLILAVLGLAAGILLLASGALARQRR